MIGTRCRVQDPHSSTATREEATIDLGDELRTPAKGEPRTGKSAATGGELLDSQLVQFERIAKTEDVLGPLVEPAKSPAAAPQAPAVSPLNSNQMTALVKVGEDLLHSGDIAAARTVLKRAATAGDARAALKLGMTFDQGFLTEWGVMGFDPDPAQAREWYDRARRLGSTEASRHLERLASKPR